MLAEISREKHVYHAHYMSNAIIPIRSIANPYSKITFMKYKNHCQRIFRVNAQSIPFHICSVTSSERHCQRTSCMIT